MPITESTPRPRAIRSTALPWRSVKLENTAVTEAELSLPPVFLPLPSNIMPAGIIINAITKASEIPMVIIQPKSITGRILLTTKDRKATIVVSTV